VGMEWNHIATTIKLAMAEIGEKAESHAETIDIICAFIVPLAVIIITLIMVNR